MITISARMPDGRIETARGAADVPALLAQDGVLLWVDIEGGARDEGEPLLRDVFGFHHLSIDDCYNALLDPPKIDDYGAYLFIIVHDVAYDAAAAALATSELNLYVGANYVVSYHHGPMHAVDELQRRARNHGLAFGRNAAFLAHALFDVVVDDLHPVVEALDDEIAELEERVIDRPERATLEVVLRLKRNAQRLKRSILPQRDVANRLSRGEYASLIPPDTLMYFRDVYDHTVRVEEMIDSVRDLSDSALNTYLSSVNNRTNEVMKTLAIVTVVFLPLTLIAGIYGTNFENVPEYELRFGYVGMLLAMLALAGALVAWFRWRRWF
jgi:magnesium transporter